MKMLDPKKIRELHLKELNMKIEAYINLKRFCEQNSIKCFNKNKDCDECNIRQLINELEEEIFLEA